MQNVFPLLGERINKKFNLGEEMKYIIHLTLPLSLKYHD